MPFVRGFCHGQTCPARAERTPAAPYLRGASQRTRSVHPRATDWFIPRTIQVQYLISGAHHHRMPLNRSGCYQRAGYHGGAYSYFEPCR